jgi:hypothetical protein
LVRLGSAINPALISDLDSSIGDYVSVLSGLKEGDQVVVGSRKTPC